jgi:hypothetical protein
VSIVDLDDSELLHQLVIYLQLFLLELGNHLLTHVDRQDCYNSVEVFKLLLSNVDCGLQSAGIFLILEDGAEGFLTLVHIFQIGLSVRLFGLGFLERLLEVLLK